MKSSLLALDGLFNLYITQYRKGGRTHEDQHRQSTKIPSLLTLQIIQAITKLIMNFQQAFGNNEAAAREFANRSLQAYLPNFYYLQQRSDLELQKLLLAIPIERDRNTERPKLYQAFLENVRTQIKLRTKEQREKEQAKKIKQNTKGKPLLPMLSSFWKQLQSLSFLKRKVGQQIDKEKFCFQKMGMTDAQEDGQYLDQSQSRLKNTHNKLD